MVKIWLSILLVSGTLAPTLSVGDPKSECDQLADTLLPLAKFALTKYHTFFAFGAGLAEGGAIVPMGRFNRRERRPSPETVELLGSEYDPTELLHKYKATALVKRMRIYRTALAREQTAVAIILHHRDGYGAILFLPYEVKARQVIFGETFTEEIEYASGGYAFSTD